MDGRYLKKHLNEKLPHLKFTKVSKRSVGKSYFVWRYQTSDNTIPNDYDKKRIDEEVKAARTKWDEERATWRSSVAPLNPEIAKQFRMQPTEDS